MKPPSWHQGHPPRAEGENYHHLFFPNNIYKSAFEKQFRNHVGLVIPLDKQVHSYLHFVVPPPPKFTKNEMADCIDFVKQGEEYDSDTNKFWGAEAVMRYTIFLEMDSRTNNDKRMHNIRDNLAQQIGVMANNHTYERPI